MIQIQPDTASSLHLYFCFFLFLCLVEELSSRRRRGSFTEDGIEADEVGESALDMVEPEPAPDLPSPSNAAYKSNFLLVCFISEQLQGLCFVVGETSRYQKKIFNCVVSTNLLLTPLLSSFIHPLQKY